MMRNTRSVGCGVREHTGTGCKRIYAYDGIAHWLHSSFQDTEWIPSAYRTALAPTAVFALPTGQGVFSASQPQPPGVSVSYPRTSDSSFRGTPSKTSDTATTSPAWGIVRGIERSNSGSSIWRSDTFLPVKMLIKESRRSRPQ